MGSSQRPLTDVDPSGSTCVAYQVFVTRTDGSYSSLGEINPGLPGTTIQGGYGYRQC